MFYGLILITIWEINVSERLRKLEPMPVCKNAHRNCTLLLRLLFLNMAMTFRSVNLAFII